MEQIKDKMDLHNCIRDIMGNDNSLTLKGCIEQGSLNISKSKLSREFKAAGLTRKRLKKRSQTRREQVNIDARLQFVVKILGKRRRTVLFLDESGFNLHTSCNYGYSEINRDAVLYQPKSKGKNISLCGIISQAGFEYYRLIEGAFNGELFIDFLRDAENSGLFRNNPILVLDNVRFHHCAEVERFCGESNIELLFLPAYSPDMNPIENVFSVIKGNLDSIRPRAVTKTMLKEHIAKVIDELREFRGFYDHFWATMNKIVNREIN